MGNDVSQHIPLVEAVRMTIEEAVHEGLHVSVPPKEKAKIVVSLLVQAMEHSKAVEVLLHSGLFTQALATCRTLVEIMALTSGIINNEKMLKLFEKKSLENFKRKLSNLRMLDRVSGIDETIASIHSDGTSALAIERLLGDLEKRATGEDRKLYYVGYRILCEYTHPDYMILMDSVEVISEDQCRIRTHALEHAEASLGLGMMSAIATVMIADGDNSGVQINPRLLGRLTELLNKAFDLMAPMEPDR